MHTLFSCASVFAYAVTESIDNNVLIAIVQADFIIFLIKSYILLVYFYTNIKLIVLYNFMI